MYVWQAVNKPFFFIRFSPRITFKYIQVKRGTLISVLITQEIQQYFQSPTLLIFVVTGVEAMMV
jgi:hypothetical protein